MRVCISFTSHKHIHLDTVTTWSNRCAYPLVLQEQSQEPDLIYLMPRSIDPQVNIEFREAH